MIEHKTLYDLRIPHAAFPNATEATTRETANATTKKEVHVTKDRGRRISQLPASLLGGQPFGYETRMLTIILSLQVRLKDVKICAQQSISNYLQGGNLH